MARKAAALPPPINQFPKLGHSLQHLVFGHGQLGAKEEILECVLVQDAMDEQARLGALEINPILLGAIAVQMALFAFELAEFIGIGLVEVLGQEIEFAENLQLKQFGQMGQFGGAAVVEDNLEHGWLDSRINQPVLWTAVKNAKMLEYSLGIHLF